MAKTLFVLVKPEFRSEDRVRPLHAFTTEVDALRFAQVQEIQDGRVLPAGDGPVLSSREVMFTVDRFTGEFCVMPRSLSDKSHVGYIDPYLSQTGAGLALWHVAFTPTYRLLEVMRVYKDKDCAGDMLPGLDGYDVGYFHDENDYRFHAFASTEKEAMQSAFGRHQVMFGPPNVRLFPHCRKCSSRIWRGSLVTCTG